jgi:hypothetical protein
LTYEK